MKKRVIILLSIALIALMTFTSCKSVRKAPEDTEAPSVSDKKDTPKDGNEASADTDVPEGKADGTNENIPANAPEASSDNTGKADNSLNSGEKAQSETSNDKPITKASVGSASYAYVSYEKLQEDSDLIFVGEYTGQSFETIPDKDFINERFMHKEIYTNYIFKPLNIIKGSDADEITVRCPGGILDGTLYVERNTPNFEAGKKYLIYLMEYDKMSADDKTSYCIITTKCFEIDDTDKLIVKGEKEEDKIKIQAQYDAALADIQAETE